MVLREVSVTFPRRTEPVLREVSLHLGPGEQVIVLGASGSGKSTVLHVITGVVPHTISATMTGEVTIAAATQTTSVIDRSRHLGVLAQDPTAAVCLPGVEQELALPLENQATDPATIGPRISAALDAVGAAALRERATATLSGGESQRVALAAAMVTEPQVLLLDEPTSMLDPAGIGSVRAALTGAVEKYGPAVVLVEHRLDEWAGTHGVTGLPARALALGESGEVIADGPTAVVLREHAHQLHAAGCWLPLDAELYALTGTEGALTARTNVELLHALAADAPNMAVIDDRAAPVLTARDLSVGRAKPMARRSRRRRRKNPAEPGAAAVPALLSGIDLSVRPGEVVALLGANGVGKSTLLLTLAGLLAPLTGTVAGARPGLVFQNAEHQFLAHTVAEEIAHGLAPEVAEEVVARQLRRHRLTHLAGQSPFRLSGGEKRRLSLAAMLAHSRPVLLADEPTLGLDRRDTIATTHTLQDFSTGGGAVVLASHDLRTVTTLADRVIVLGDGGVLADGPTTQVLSDADVLARAGLVLPPLVAWLLNNLPARAVAHVLRQLDDAVPASRPVGVAR
ncbi:ABC transporter ATP-binding protein [Georgenia subflava]|uniref:ABC transporter ATP-binding protein n=1 Tax=Georgenia subflava TaxID=1622177 RepID=UPI00128C27C9|nr:ATP-binding cassette domain-containing protein [Georgenia subflava]